METIGDRWRTGLAGLGVMALASSLAAGMTAFHLGYADRLGSPDIRLAGYILYGPWRYFEWLGVLGPEDRPALTSGALCLLAGVCAFLTFTLAVRPARSPAVTSPFGDARWATQGDITKANLFSSEGVLLGWAHGRALRHHGDDHILMIAPTNSGKTVGMTLPAALTWPQSMIVLDIKSEVWRLSARRRSMIGPVYKFAPASTQSHRFNPLTSIRQGVHEVRDAQLLADVLIDPDGSQRSRSHWELRAGELLTALCLWTLYAEEEKTLRRVAELLSDPDRPAGVLLEDMVRASISSGRPHPVVAGIARQLLDMADAERSGVISTALGRLTTFRDPILAAATETSDFSIEDLARSGSPATLYICAPPEDLGRLRPVLRLMLNMTFKRLTEIAANEKAPQPVLLLLDEFPQLGRLDFLEDALAFIRAYGLRACLIAQSLTQISRIYGENSSIVDNCSIRIAFACNDERSARRISDMLGQSTHARRRTTYRGEGGGLLPDPISSSIQENARPLMTPGEIMRLPADECLILARATPPIRARKLRYFAIPQLSALIAPPPPLILSPQPAPDWRDRVWRPEAADVPDVVPASPPSHGHQAGKGSIPDLFDEDPRGSHSLSEAT